MNSNMTRVCIVIVEKNVGQISAKDESVDGPLHEYSENYSG
jgi:hypothetical protein